MSSIPQPGPRSRSWLALTAMAIAVIVYVIAPAAAYATGPAPTPPGANTSIDPQGAKSAKPSKAATFGIQPANPRGATARPFFNLLVAPATTTRDNVRITNFSLAPMTLKVYATDGGTSEDGSFNVPLAKTATRGVGSWVKLRFLDSKQSVNLPGRSRIDIPFDLVAPRGAEPGDHAGAIVVSFTSTSKDAQGNAVNVENRVASRVYARVSGPLHPRLEATDVHASYGQPTNPVGQGRAGVTFTVRNTGNVRLAAHNDARLRGLFGLSYSTAKDLPEIMPGDQIKVTLPNASVPPLLKFNYDITVTPHTALEGVTKDVPKLSAVRGSGSFWAIPIVATGVLGAVLLLLLLIRIVRRAVGRRKLRKDVAQPRPGGDPKSELPDAAAEVTLLTRRMAKARAKGGSLRREVPWSIAALAVCTALGVITGGPALADPSGSLTFAPAKGFDETPMYVLTSGPCEAAATNVVAMARGKGFPAEGQVVVGNSSAGVSHTGPFVLPLQNTMAAYAHERNIVLSGPYAVSLICENRLGTHKYTTFSGTITFQTAKTYTAPSPSTQLIQAVQGQQGAQADGYLPGTAPIPNGAGGSAATKKPAAGPVPSSGGAGSAPTANATPLKTAGVATPGGGTTTGNPGAAALGAGPTHPVGDGGNSSMMLLAAAGVILIAFGLWSFVRSGSARRSRKTSPATPEELG